MTVISRILQDALPRVATNGWTGALTLAIREKGLSDQAVSIFPHGGALDLVQYWLKENVNELKSVQLTASSEHGRVKELMAHRLRANAKLGPFAGTAQDLLIKSPGVGSHELAHLSDEIWWLAGDKSTDSFWYTRRGSLGAIYASSELFQRFDKSTGFKDTIKLANKQIDGLCTAESAGESVLEWAKFNVIAGFNVAKSLTR